MGKKQQALQLCAGSMQKNYWRYIIKWHMAGNPKDYYADKFFG